MQILNISPMVRPAKQFTSKLYPHYTTDFATVALYDVTVSQDNYYTSDSASVACTVEDGLVRETLIHLKPEVEGAVVNLGAIEVQRTSEVTYHKLKGDPEDASVSLVEITCAITRSVAYLKLKPAPENAAVSLGELSVTLG